MDRQTSFDELPDVLAVDLAGTDGIRRLAAASVTNAEQFQRSKRPEPQGVFSEHLFGHDDDWECACGRLHGVEQIGYICIECEAPVRHCRSSRLGCIDLDSPVAHPLFLRQMALLLNYTAEDLWHLIHFASEYVAVAVVDPGNTPYTRGQILSDDEVRQAWDLHGRRFEEDDRGASVCQRLLQTMNLHELANCLRQALKQVRDWPRRHYVLRRLRLVDAILRAAPDDPEGFAARLVVESVPVVPPALRPTREVGGNHASGGVNHAYSSLLNFNQRLRRLRELNAPDVIVLNDRRFIQCIVNVLINRADLSRVIWERSRQTLTNAGARVRRLCGERLLQKRVDYSAKGVIAPDADLESGQCGVPLRLATELFRTLLLAHLKRHGPEPLRRVAGQLYSLLRPRLRGGDDEAWRAGMRLYQEVLHDLGDDLILHLAEAIRGRRVLLTRPGAGIPVPMVALEAVPVEGKAVRVHPTAGALLRARYGGATVNVHVLLSDEPTIEGMVLLDAGVLTSAFSPLPLYSRGEGLGVRGSSAKDSPLTPNPSPPITGERGTREDNPLASANNGREKPMLAYFRHAQQVRHQRIERRECRLLLRELCREMVAAGQGIIVSEEDCGTQAERGPLTCCCERGICQRCYGPAEIGTPAGVRAALAVAQAATPLPLATLTRLGELLQGDPDDPAPLARCSGFVRLGRTGEDWREVFVERSGHPPRLHLVPLKRAILHRDGDAVQHGEPLATGPLSPHEIVYVRGLRVGREYLLGELRQVFEGVDPPLQRRNLELILSCLLRRVVVSRAGDSDLVPGVVMRRTRFMESNAPLKSKVVIVSPGASRMKVGTLIEKDVFDRECAKLCEAELVPPTARPAQPARSRPRCDSLKSAARQASLIAGLCVNDPLSVLSRAAIERRRDEGIDLHTAAVRGVLMPAGTGYARR